jgi:hypothetical protein
MVCKRPLQAAASFLFECLERNQTQTREAFVHLMGGRERDEDVLLLGTNLGFL